MINKFLEFKIFSFNNYSITILDIIIVLFIFILTRFLLLIIKKAINGKNKFNKLDTGSSFALFQLVKYFIWTISIALMLESIGVKLTILLAGSAALLVGIGLGLQQTFNDVVSGIILLFEQSVKVDDILDIDGEVVIIKEIGLRTSKGLSRNEVIITLPNNLITTNKVINWSNKSKKAIFRIHIGVAYGSDVDLVIKLLKESALEHEKVLKNDLVEVRFTDFADSSLNFSLLFYSKSLFDIERVKSDIRIIINKKFIENKIMIPFPQMDLHLKRT